MLISEVFYSIQGEGELTGVPSVFIRTSGCNLRCVWCDTRYASWEPEGIDRTIESLLHEAQSHPTQHVVLTGGEPMIAKGINNLADKLQSVGKHITIETAGTVLPNGIPCDLASISPKLRHSTPSERQAGAWSQKHESVRIQIDVLTSWIENYNYQLKFVISNESDLEELQELLSCIPVEVPTHKIMLMPEGVCSNILSARTNALIDLCKAQGYRYCPRLHIDHFGNQRGT